MADYYLKYTTKCYTEQFYLQYHHDQYYVVKGDVNVHLRQLMQILK